MGELFRGHITRLSNNELVIENTSNRVDGSTNYKTQKVKVGDEYVDAKMTTVGDASIMVTRNETWEKTEKKPSKE